LKNPLTKQGLFATPKSFKEIGTMIEGLSRTQRAVGYTIAAMTWNRAVEMVQNAIDLEDQKEAESLYNED